KGLTSLPVIADPSHGSGRRELVGPLAKAALAAGLDGVIVEVHPDPDASVSDAQQSISTADFARLMRELHLAPQTDDLDPLREAVDEIDQALLGLLIRRMALSDRIGQAKNRVGIGVHQPVREQELVEALAARAGGSLPKDAVQSIWGAILVQSRRRQLPDARGAENSQ
ncbi:protein containing DAHP synthetase I/KDSA, partial [mine drainage metagenome]